VDEEDRGGEGKRRRNDSIGVRRKKMDWSEEQESLPTKNKRRKTGNQHPRLKGDILQDLFEGGSTAAKEPASGGEGGIL